MLYYIINLTCCLCVYICQKHVALQSPQSVSLKCVNKVHSDQRRRSPRARPSVRFCTAQGMALHLPGHGSARPNVRFCTAQGTALHSRGYGSARSKGRLCTAECMVLHGPGYGLHGDCTVLHRPRYGSARPRVRLCTA